MPKSKTPKGNARTRRLARARALKTMRKQLEDRAWKVEGGPMLVASVWELAKKAGAADIAFERSLGGKACAFTDAEMDDLFAKRTVAFVPPPSPPPLAKRPKQDRDAGAAPAVACETMSDQPAATSPPALVVSPCNAPAASDETQAPAAASKDACPAACARAIPFKIPCLVCGTWFDASVGRCKCAARSALP